MKRRTDLQSPSPPTPIVMPANADTEISVLGGLLLNPVLLEDCGLAPECFHDGSRRTVFEAMLAIHAAGGQADLVATQEHMAGAGTLEKIGGVMGLVALTAGLVSRGEMIIRHAQQLQGLARRRRIILEARSLAALASDLTADPGEAWARSRRALDDTLGGGAGAAQQPAEYVQEWLDRCERLGQAAEVSVPVPYRSLRRLVTGLFPGELMILAARPGVGKTALALNLVEYALASGVPCGIFSLEMHKFLLLNRLASARELIDAQRFRDGRFSGEDWAKLFKYAELVRGYPLRTWDQGWLRPRDLLAQCRAWKREMGLRFVMLDYLQLCMADQRGGSREREVSEVSRACKQAAVELDLAFLVLSQLNREADKTKRPLLSQLRESGSIEQDADQILFLVPPGTAGAAYDSDVAEVEGVLAKGRNNAVGNFRLLYHRKHVLFADAED